MTSMSSLSGKKVAVVGMGLSGIAATRLLVQQKAKVFVTDDKPDELLQEEKKALRRVPVEYRQIGRAHV